ncbi:MAG: response regulator transcription factor, partial [Acidimicrobiales bacterium]
ALRRWVPGLPLVAVRNPGRDGAGPAALRASVTISTQAHAGELLAAIGAAHHRIAGRAAPAPGAGDAAPGPLHRLTPRELHVLAAVITGATNASIADRLGLSTHTVRTHLRHILQKLGADNRLEAAVRARACGLAGGSSASPG